MEFNETQRFRQGWLWLIIASTLIVPLAALINHREESLSVWTITIILSIPVLIVMLFLSMKLETRVNSAGVYYRFAPFQLKERFIPWNDVENAYIRKYNPILEYGGWGMRSSFNHGKAYNVAGNMGLQLHLRNGRRLLIGTQQPESLQQLLDYMRIPGKKQ